MSIEQRKSQISIFLILGIVIVLAVFLIISSNRNFAEISSGRKILNAKEAYFSSQSIKNFVGECLFIVSKDSLEHFGANFTDEQLEMFVENNIDVCLDFSVFERQGLEVSKEQAEVEASINEKDVLFEMTYPIIINNPARGERIEIEDFTARHEISFGET